MGQVLVTNSCILLIEVIKLYRRGPAEILKVDRIASTLKVKQLVGLY